MAFWIGLWKVCLIGALVLFAILAVTVTIGGARDLKKLFQRLKEPDDQNGDLPF